MEGEPDVAVLSSELAVSPPPEPEQSQTPPPPRQAPKSPPLAFAPTSNDSLAPLIHFHDGDISPSTARADHGVISPDHATSTDGMDMQAIVHQQANALQLAHGAFAAERRAWSLERDRLYQRIGSLEKLLRNGDHYSPAKSPILSPTNGSATSLQSRAASNASRLPIIEEDDDVSSLSSRREGAPRSIDLPGRPAVPNPHVSFGSANDSNTNGLTVDEVPISPPSTAKALSPLPAHNLSMAGHTPLRAARVPTPPPQNMLDGMDDTPTRNNTHINTLLTQSEKEEEEEEVLKGPLNLPELPNQPGEGNFTLEALSKRLEQIEHDPDDAGQPTVLSRPATGLASPADMSTSDRRQESPSTAQHTSVGDCPGSYAGSSLISPFTTLSPHADLDEETHQRFESGGIKLKKKPSSNFGAPFGSLGGFGGMRKQS